MSTFKKLALTAMAVGAVASATPAMAVITTFASFQNIGNARNVRWQRTGTTNGSFYSINSSGNQSSVAVKFSFAQNYFTSNNIAQSITALMTISGTTTGDPATQTPIPNQGTYLTQNIDSLVLSFKSTAPITVNNTTYAAGANLLSIVLPNPTTNSTIGGFLGATSGGLSNSTALGHSVTYTSDFLDFSNTVNRSFSVSLDAILNGNPNVGLRATAGQSLNNFRANATGSFSSDPAPLISAIPEPAVWGLMIGGFGVVGFQSRRRRSVKTVTA